MSSHFWPSVSPSSTSTQKHSKTASFSLDPLNEVDENELFSGESSSTSASVTSKSTEQFLECFTPPNTQEKKVEFAKQESIKQQNIFRIAIQESFEKTVDLPHLSVWDRLETPSNFLRGRLLIQIREKGLLLDRESAWMVCNCLMSRQGHFIVYMKEKSMKGHAINLSRAKKVDISCVKSVKRSGNTSSTDEKYCLITIKWTFGTLSINLVEDQVRTWRQFILDAFEENLEHQPFSCTLTHSAARDKNSVKNQSVAKDSTPSITDSKTPIEKDLRSSVMSGYSSGNKNASRQCNEEKSFNSEAVTEVSNVQPRSTGSAVLRRHSEGALLHYNRNQKSPLPSWVDELPSAFRFRLTKEYFENSASFKNEESKREQNESLS